jgi:hypothetical protein
MLRAYYNMPSADFVAQLRTYVIAMGLGPQVVDAVDNLTGVDEIEDQHAEELEDAENESERRGRESMKTEMLSLVSRVLADNPDLSIADVITLLEEVEV